MADEFAKGLGIFTTAGLGWMVLAGWYRTPSFESTHQLVAAPEKANTVFDQLGIFMNDVLFWTALVGALTFWLLIPVGRQAQQALADRSA